MNANSPRMYVNRIVTWTGIVHGIVKDENNFIVVVALDKPVKGREFCVLSKDTTEDMKFVDFKKGMRLSGDGEDGEESLIGLNIKLAADA